MIPAPGDGGPPGGRGDDAPARALRGTFGLDAFRPGQREVIDRLLAGRPVLAVMPTGGGKSLCYQLPALLLEGVTIVISPLIALMKDQVDALRRLGVAAARLDSSLTAGEARQVHDDLAAGRLKLLYVAPERLSNERFVGRLRRARVGLLAVDEAHCISEWGHNFRPEYLKLAATARALGIRRVLALTATATPAVAADVRRAFEIAPGDHVQTGFHRPNLELIVTPCPAALRRDLLAERLRAVPGPAIVYVTLQRTAEELAESLAGDGIAAAPYHAGLAPERRVEVQDAFMGGHVRVVVATIAFGMGIDKADIRAIYHFNLPKSLESYAQETGRAGRDGLPARCELLACLDDVPTLANFSYGDTPTPEALAALVRELLGHEDRFDVSQYDLAGRHDIRELVVATALTYLELEGVVQATGPFYTGYKLKLLRAQDEVVARFDPPRQAFLRAVFAAGNQGKTWLTLDTGEVARRIGEPRERIVKAVGYLEEQGDLEVQAAGLRQGYRVVARPGDPGPLIERLVTLFQRREQRDVERLELVVRFAAAPGCKARHLLEYFGEALAQDCGRCSGCSPEPTLVSGLPDSGPRLPGTVEEALVRDLAAETHPQLAHPRQLTRFLCGLTSPASSRARLTRDRRFGRLSDLPFQEVLRLVERVLDRA